MANSDVIDADREAAGRLVFNNELRQIELDDCRYSLVSYRCSKCERVHYRVFRFAGAFFSTYIVPDYFGPDQFEEFVSDLHEHMFIDHHFLIEAVRQVRADHNGPQGIETDGTYLDQMMDFARLQLLFLKKLGRLRCIEYATEKNPTEKALLAAFDLGYAVSELRLRDTYEDAIFEGWRLQEGREIGREAAAKAKSEQTRRTRSAICRAARDAYEANPDLARNDTATARVIEERQLPDLCRSDGRSIGYEAIVKHLRTLRNEGKLQRIS